MTPAPDTFAALVDRFSHFLIDQFGVLLDGSGAYPDAPASLKALADRLGSADNIVLISNSGRRSIPNEARLTRLGFSRSSYRLVLSSGEVAHRYLQRALGTTLVRDSRVLILSRGDDNSEIAELPLRATSDPADADMILLAGSRGDVLPLQHYEALLSDPASRSIPCLCTNPDNMMLTAEGQSFGAGRIARLYEDMGGHVEWIGKPYPQIYREALALLGNPDPSTVLAIGDSPAHDVRGGQAAGCATALVRTGIHADAGKESLERLFAEHGRPDFLVNRFYLET